jgi:formylglycine-generating enzyme
MLIKEKYFTKIMVVLMANYLFFIPNTIAQNGSTFITIPKGNYTIGKKGHLINPQRNIAIESFSISSTEITNAQFEVFIKAANYKTDAQKYQNAMVFEPGLEEYKWLEDSTANWKFPNGITRGGIENKMNHPVTCISYRDAIAYCKWAKVRLPKLEEWEIASRAYAKTDFAWGNNKDSLKNYGNVWYGIDHLKADTTDGFIYTSPVASFKPNTWGLFDMYGNVFEFCTGKLEKYKNNKNVVHARGGSWWCSAHSCSFFNSVDIGRVAIKASFSNQGFRVVQLQNNLSN